MPANPAFSVLVTLLVSLVPIAIYCLILASINRRSAPVLVSGVLDFAGVLFAASGMVLWAGPAMLATLHERSIAGESTRAFEELLIQWWALWAGYYGMVVTGGIFFLWLRRPTTSIYNVQTDLVPGLVATTLQRLGFDFAQNAKGQFLIAPAKSLAPSMADVAHAAQSAAASGVELAPPPYSAALEIDQFSSLCHATLHWYETEPAVRREIEEELRKQLTGACALDNPAGLWQLGVGILLFGAIFLSTLFFILAILFPRSW